MLSVVIPTLQKNLKVLILLVDTLLKDNSVAEIIIIDNSLKGFNYDNSKVRVIMPNENLYVNPSWNLGVNEAKSDIVALLNDDISICENFCSDVISQMNKDMGIVGVNSGDFVEEKPELSENPPKESLILEKCKFMDLYFGIAMFFYKSSYYQIPDEMKIVYGDVWLYFKNKKNKKDNYRICNQKIFHIGSLSSGSKSLIPICKKDAKIYKKLMVKWYDRLFSYEETWKGYKFRLLGLTFMINKHNAKG